MCPAERSLETPIEHQNYVTFIPEVGETDVFTFEIWEGKVWSS
jgi:hypothetical protein